MQNYKDLQNNVHVLDDIKFAYVLPAGCVAISQSEADALRAPTLAQVKASQCALMDEAYATANAAPISYMSTTFQADEASQSLIANVLTASGGSLPTGFQWYDINNVGVAMNFGQLQGLAGAILMRGQPLFDNKRAKKAEINAATSVSAAQAITF